MTMDAVTAALNINDTFAPITAEELSQAACTNQAAANEDLAHISPIPDGAPTVPALHVEEALWTAAAALPTVDATS